MDFGLYEMKIVRNNPSSVKSDHRLTRTNDLSPLGSDLSEVYCIYILPALKICSGIQQCHSKIVKRITDGLLMLSQNCSSTNMHFHFKYKSDIQMFFLYFNFVFNNNNNNRVNIELLHI